MLSKPFRGMTRPRLFLLLVLLLALEAAGAAGLYSNNRQAAAGTAVVPSATPGGAVLRSVTAMPSLLIAKKPATFAVRIADLANKPVSYKVIYTDGTTQTAKTTSDVSGYSSSTFTLRYAPAKRKETITVQLLAGAVVRSSTDFSVLLPAKS